MGQTLTVKKGQKIVVTIRFRSPATNNNGDRVRVNHIDLIAGNVTGRIAPVEPRLHDSASNPSAHVVKTFARSRCT